MDLSKSTRSIVAVSTLIAGAVGLWLWMKRRQRISRKEAVQLGCINKSVIHIVSTAEEWNQCYDQLLKDIARSKILGIDCEWVLKGPVALLQIASSSGLCVLVRLCQLGRDGIPPSLSALLSDRSILKLGVAVNDDAKKLMRDYGLKMSGCVDLRHILQRVRGIYTCRSWGLQGLARGVLGISMSKDFKIRCGNWETPRLSPKQIDYAALDALVAVDIFAHLVVAKVTGMNPRLHPQSACQVSMDVFQSSARSLCQGIVDVGYDKGEGSPKARAKQVKQGTQQKEKGKYYSTRSRPLWDNCELLAPDGQPLCTCDSRKARWYISKGLGDKLSENPLVVKLRFEPSGRPKDARNYYLQQKENVCVVCGSTESYSRKFIVPQEYRKYFPLLLKEHTSHDVLLLCPDCHRRSADHDATLKLQLAEECGAPLNSGYNSSVQPDHYLQQVQSAARALRHSRDKIPEARVKELEQIVMDYFGVPELAQEMILEASEINIHVARDGFVNHAQRVVCFMAEHGGLIDFQTRWRQNFIDTMRPQYLPAFWAVDYVPENWKEDGGDGDGNGDDVNENNDVQFVVDENGDDDVLKEESVAKLSSFAEGNDVVYMGGEEDDEGEGEEEEDFESEEDDDDEEEEEEEVEEKKVKEEK